MGALPICAAAENQDELQREVHRLQQQTIDLQAQHHRLQKQNGKKSKVKLNHLKQLNPLVK